MTGVAQGPSVREAEPYGLAPALMRNVRRLRLCCALEPVRRLETGAQGMEQATTDATELAECIAAEAGRITKRKFCAWCSTGMERTRLDFLWGW